MRSAMSPVKWYPSLGTDECLRHNTAGVPYEEFTCVYPRYGATWFDFEKNYNPVPARDMMRENSWVPMMALVLYFAWITLGPAYFQNRPAWNWRNTLAFWNFALSAFSFWGFSRTFPALMHNMFTYTWRENFCIDPESNIGSGSTGLWTQLFVLSKFPELFDTFFIVVHKKKLIFLHWYHHVSVLLFCWHGYINNPPTGIIFCTMNYGVHAVMYLYYFLMAVKLKPRWVKPVWITVAQISQMVVGCAVTAIGCYLLLWEKPEGCRLTHQNITPCLVMYGSYLFLFLQFFFKRYALRPSIKSGPKKKKV